MTETIQLLQTKKAHLEQLFLFQLDPEAIYQAAFTPTYATDKIAYLEKYNNHLKDPQINMKTIFIDNSIVGSVAKYVMHDNAEITYWIDKKFWGRGVASVALKKFLQSETTRPIFGCVAFDNIASQKVLEKCGFIKIGSDKGYANGRQAEIEEYIYKLT
jgi:RimJ/RimL family protein N-acetyltransferase